ncbi:MAG: hypothetical protein HOV80_38430 [Polyangiaceae bacterium]|nr:hypothetical protein [Polyangiaceae bacterium]
MKKLLYPALIGLSLGGTSALWLAACSAGDDSGDGLGTGGGNGGTTGTGKGDASIDVAPDGEKPPGPIDYSGLCGEGACVPGGVNNCNEGTGGGGTGGGSGIGGAGGGGGSDGTGSGTGGAAPLGCQVDVSGIEPEPKCMPVNPLGQIDTVCIDSSQCAAGNACVVVGGSGSAVCRPYCCEDLDCPGETYCAPQPVQGFLTERVPVCTKAIECDPFNETQPAACKENETCTIVGPGGMTGCVPTGDGQSCDPCPCAEGYMCNLGTGTCQKLCHTNMSDECGGMGGTCQGFSDDIGVCIGGNADCGF